MLKKEEMQSPESSGQHTRTDLSPDNQSISDDLASLSEDSLDEKEGQAISSQPEPANEIDLVQDDVEIGALDTDRLCTASPSFLPRIAQTFAFCTSTGKLSVLSLVRRIYWSPDLSPDAAQAALQDATGNTAYLLACRAAGIKPCADILLQAAPLPSRPARPPLLLLHTSQSPSPSPRSRAGGPRPPPPTPGPHNLPPPPPPPSPLLLMHLRRRTAKARRLGNRLGTES